MARASNTGRGNYPAAKMPGSAGQMREVLKSIPKMKYPNRNASTTEYKRTLKKEPESNE